MFKKNHKKLKKISSITTAIIFIFVLIYLSPLAIFNSRIYPNIYVAGIYIGNLSDRDATNKLIQNVKLPDKIEINLNGEIKEILTSEVVRNIEYTKTVERAQNIKSNNLFLKPINLPLSIDIDEERLLESILIISDDAVTKPIYPSATIVDNKIQINKGQNGVEVDTQKLRQDIGLNISFLKNKKVVPDLKQINVEMNESEIEIYRINAEKLLDKKIILKLDNETITLNNEDIISFLDPNGFSDKAIKDRILEISRKLNRNPQNSVFVVENGKVQEFTPSKDGVVVNEDLLLEKIKQVPEEIDIPVIKTSPKINNKDVNDLGIDSLIGTGHSSFVGSIPNRVFNVNLAQSRFKGVLIPPNEVVSFNDVLGDVSSYTGYKAAYVIKDGKTVLGDGGGVCQVSTTLFRAVLNAGLPVVERRAHAYRVGYYEQGFGPGLDATVYSPTTDFKFKNDTGAYILLQPTINLNDLTLKFEIYGTSDGRVSTVSKPVITSSIKPADDLYVDDPTLPVGQVKQIEHRAYGAKVVFDYKVTRNGEELINQKFVSNYRPWQAVYLRGTKI